MPRLGRVFADLVALILGGVLLMLGGHPNVLGRPEQGGLSEHLPHGVIVVLCHVSRSQMRRWRFKAVATGEIDLWTSKCATVAVAP